MKLDETTISRAIMMRYFEKLQNCLELDAAIVGGGPSGLVAGYMLAKKGMKTALFERKLSIGGGMWGGGMLFNEIVVQKGARKILEELDVRTRPWEAEGYYTADAVEAVCAITSKAVKAGLTVLNGISIEDVVIEDGRVKGLVINWSTVEAAGLHVDPLSLRSRFVIDATGHDTEVVSMIEKKSPGSLLTSSGRREGEKFMAPEEAERLTVENTREAYPGLYVSGMACNATFGGPRMGPIFGGMLLSGMKAAELIIQASGR